MHPDILVVRHNCSGAALLLSQYVDAAVINAGDGRHSATQALLDALTIRRRIGRIEGLKIAIYWRHCQQSCRAIQHPSPWHSWCGIEARLSCNAATCRDW